MTIRYEGSSIAYDVVIHKDVMVPMRDGVELAADIYSSGCRGRDIAEGEFPVILERTPYDKTASYVNVTYMQVFRSKRAT